MSKKAGRLGDIGSSHGCYPPTPTISGSPDVLINGRPAIRVDDPLLLHGCPNCPPHPRKMSKGCASVLINGKPACGVGDDVNCGGVLITGSGDVLYAEYDETSTGSEPNHEKDSLPIQRMLNTDSATLKPCDKEKNPS